MAEGAALPCGGYPTSALAALQQSLALDPEYAMTHFAIAQACIALNDVPAARKELDLANSLDRRGPASTANVRRTIVEAAGAHQDALLLDVQSAFYDQPAAANGPFRPGSCSSINCHPTQAVGTRFWRKQSCVAWPNGIWSPTPAGL